MHIIAPVNITTEAGGFTRSQPANYFDRLGALVSAAANVLRINYDPSDLKAAPYPLIEPATANRITNNTMQGAATGAPGTLPTGWGVGKTSNSSASWQVVGIGTENGIECIDIRFYGPAELVPITIEARFDGAAALPGETWALSAFVKLLSGGKPGIAFRNRLLVQNNQAAAVHNEIAPFVPAAASERLSSGRREQIFKVTDSTAYTSSAYCGAEIAAGTAYDYTLRIGLPQLEKILDGYALKATSPIKTSGASVTRPADVLAAGNGMIYSNLTENDADDAPLWVSGQAVAKDQYRRRAETHKVYRALQAIPTTVTATPESNPKDGTGNPYWYEWEPTNRWAAFDTTLDTVSAGGEVLYWIVRPGEITGALAILAADAADVRVSMISGAGRVVYRKTKSMLLKTSRRWSDWFFKTRERRSDEVFLDMPYLKTSIICVTITKPGSTAKVGDIKMGRLEDIGETLIEPEVRTLRRSSIKDDGYGRYRFNKRPGSKIMTANVYIEGARMDAVKRMIDKYTDEPCVIIGDERWTSLILLAYVDDFAVVLQDANNANYNLKAIGLG